MALIHLIEVPLWPPVPLRFACTFPGLCGGRKRIVNPKADIEAHCPRSCPTEKPVGQRLPVVAFYPVAIIDS